VTGDKVQTDSPTYDRRRNVRMAAAYPLIRGRARLNHMTKPFYGNNDKAKGWQKWNGKMEELRLVPFNSRMKTHSMQVVRGRAEAAG